MAFDAIIIRPSIGDLPEITQLEDRVAAVEEQVTAPVQAELDEKPSSSSIDFIVTVTQEEYDELDEPDARTLYLVVDS